MNGEEEEDALDLLTQFETILQSDPFIDEVGFIHPSQFVTLNIEAGVSPESNGVQLKDGLTRSNESRSFWLHDHKLGVSTQLLLPMYLVAKSTFMATLQQYRTQSNAYNESRNENISCDVSSSYLSLESEVMKHSRALLLLSSDFGTAWNARKLVVTKKQHLHIFVDELKLSALVLSYSPKSEQAWSHRRWVIKMVAEKCLNLPEIVGKESEQVEKIAERSKMNYRAWNHRCWLVPYMTREQVLCELKKSRKWAALHIADYSCFHYRSLLLLKILEEVRNLQGSESYGHKTVTHQLWKEELDWNQMLIKQYVGREGLWLHRRFLSLCWMRYLNGQKTSNHSCIINDEMCLVNYYSSISHDDEFEDFESQRLHATTYMLWLTKQVPEFERIIKEEIRAGKLKILPNDNGCPHKSSLWDSLLH